MTSRQGQGYTHIDLGRLLENLNSKKKASMYLLKRKAMIRFLESTDWFVCKFLSKERKVSSQGILTDIGHGSQSGVMYPYLMRQDFFHLRIITRKHLTAAILLLVCNDKRFISFFPRVIKVSVRSLNMLFKFPTRFIYKLACSVGMRTS